MENSPYSQYPEYTDYIRDIYDYCNMIYISFFQCKKEYKNQFIELINIKNNQDDDEQIDDGFFVIELD